jgi:hypothetical protein
VAHSAPSVAEVPSAQTTDVLDLQRSVGNHVVNSMLSSRIARDADVDALDVQPQTKDAAAIKKDMAGLSGATKFLDKEGGLVRWQVQFKQDPAAVVQRSPLSEQLEQKYFGTDKKQRNAEAVFEALRNKGPLPKGDADATKCLEKIFTGNDLALAKQLLVKGSELNWSAADFEARTKRGDDPFAAGHGAVQDTLGKSSGLVGAPAPIKAFFFPGKTAERALVIGGVHGSELSGIEVANRLVATLQAELKLRKLPQFTTIVVPELFPETAAQARKSPSKGTSDSNVGREVQVPWKDPAAAEKAWKKTHKADEPFPKTKPIPPARQFPAKGKTLDDEIAAGGPIDESGNRLKDDEGVDIPLMQETIALVRLIERFQPSRIASVHAHRFSGTAKRGKDAPGIFVDPRGGFDQTVDPAFPEQFKKAHKAWETAVKKATDEAKAKKVPLDPKTLPPEPKMREITATTKQGQADDALALDMARAAKKGGAHVPGSHLDESEPAVAHYSDPGHPKGRSLGDWGPEQNMTVITVEVEHYAESAGDKAREKELQAHSDALKDVFLGGVK